MKKYAFIILLGLLVGGLGMAYSQGTALKHPSAANEDTPPLPQSLPTVSAPEAPPVVSLSEPKPESPTPPPPAKITLWRDEFNGDGIIEEAPAPSASSHPVWWVDSGGRFIFAQGQGATITGDLSAADYWRMAYRKSNPIDTDNGFHPQNIFRLITRLSWHNLRQEVYFKIVNNNLSDSRYRYVSNGVLLLNRYQDESNLYYVGVRVDGAAVIKKKYRGTYYNMATKTIFPGAYDRDKDPNLLPQNTWLGLRSEVSTQADGTVEVALWLDRAGQGNWEKVLTAIDDGVQFGGAAIVKEGLAGIRTDFMDVAFDHYRVEELSV